MRLRSNNHTRYRTGSSFRNRGLLSRRDVNAYAKVLWVRRVVYTHTHTGIMLNRGVAGKSNAEGFARYVIGVPVA